MKAADAFLVGALVIACARPAPHDAPARAPEPAHDSETPSAPGAEPDSGLAPLAQPEPDAGVLPPEPEPTFEELLDRLVAQGFGVAADLVASRVAQSRRKMKLAPEEGLSLARSLNELLPAMPEAQRLLGVMPKATVELVRSVAERGVPKDEAERTAAYLRELHQVLDMQNPAPLDENTSHVIGREWHEIDYRGEGMTWEKQKSIYLPQGVPDFKSEAHLRRFFQIESRQAYFIKLYQPRGRAP